MMLGMYGLSSALEYVRSFIVIRIDAKLDMHLNARVYTAAFETNLSSRASTRQSLNDLTSGQPRRLGVGFTIDKICYQ